jgi:FixJ family two-component response regulator
MRVMTFGSAQELLDRADHEPSLFILDVNMPEIDGFALLKMLRDRGHDEPAVLITGLGDPDVQERAERSGVAAFFDKPINPLALYSTIIRLLAKTHT